MISDSTDTFFKNFHYSSIGINLNARIALCGHEYAKNGKYFWHGLQRGDTEFILWQRTISGCGLLNYDGEKIIMDRGKSMLLKIPQNHFYEVFPNSKHWEIDFIIFRGPECIRLGEALIKNFGPTIDNYSDIDVLKLANKILYQSNNSSAGELSALAYKFMILLVDKCSFSKKNIPEVFMSSKNFILGNYTDKLLQVSTLADRAKLSYPHFMRKFNSCFGFSPGAYIMQLRMELAINLLQSSQYSISEIAEYCGFASSSYFCRAFHKIYHLSPSKFRNSPNSKEE